MKRKLLYFFIFTILSIIGIGLFQDCYHSNDNEKNNIAKVNKEFVINKLQYYSSANAISNTTNYQNPEWNVNIYQYTDIAIYMDRLTEEITEKNYITNILISNISVDSNNKEIYYLNPKMFGNSDLSSNNIIKIEDCLEYNVINDTNSNNEQSYNIPIYFQDCSNPITLRYLNILGNNFKIPNDTILIHSGSLIKELGIDLRELNINLSFDLQIITQDGQNRNRRIDLEIPIENEKESILDGDFEVTVEEDIQI